MRDVIYSIGVALLFPLFLATAPFKSKVADQVLNRWAHFILRPKTRTKRYPEEPLH